MGHTFCKFSGKQMFLSRHDAIRAAENTKRRSRGEPSIYFCEHCKAYHLTHYTYQHSKAVREIEDYRPEQRKRNKKMKIIIDNAYVPNGTTVGIKDLDDGGQQLQLILFDVDNQTMDVRYTYDQAQELIEAMKIQIAKMKI